MVEDVVVREELVRHLEAVSTLGQDGLALRLQALQLDHFPRRQHRLGVLRVADLVLDLRDLVVDLVDPDLDSPEGLQVASELHPALREQVVDEVGSLEVLLLDGRVDGLHQPVFVPEALVVGVGVQLLGVGVHDLLRGAGSEQAGNLDRGLPALLGSSRPAGQAVLVRFPGSLPLEGLHVVEHALEVPGNLLAVFPEVGFVEVVDRPEEVPLLDHRGGLVNETDHLGLEALGDRGHVLHDLGHDVPDVELGLLIDDQSLVHENPPHPRYMYAVYIRRKDRCTL